MVLHGQSQGSQPGLASSGVLVPPGGPGHPLGTAKGPICLEMSAGKHAIPNLSQFMSGKKKHIL